MNKKNSKMERLLKKMLVTISVSTAILFAICFLLSLFVDTGSISRKRIPTKKTEKPLVEELFLTPNEYSRPQLALEQVEGIVMHYTANPGSTAEGNRNYFESLRIKKHTYASSHYIVGLEGEIIQCIPLDEISYASNSRNHDTISIECCHPGKNGKFNKKTYQSMIQLVAWLCGEYDLDAEDIIRHYDVTGKNCPKYFVENEDAWEAFKTEVFLYIENNQKEESDVEE